MPCIKTTNIFRKERKIKNENKESGSKFLTTEDIINNAAVFEASPFSNKMAAP